MSGDHVTEAIEIPAWEPNYAVKGDRDFVRVSASALAANPAWSCPEQLAKKAHPGTFLDLPYGSTTYPPWQGFPLGLVRDVVLQSLGAVGTDAVPGGAPSDVLARLIDAKNWDPSSLQAAKAAINGYYSVLRDFRPDPGWEDARFANYVVAADPGSGGAPTEWFAWGIHVVRADQGIWETHLLKWRGAGGHVAVPVRVAVVARNLADGFVPGPSAKWSQPFNPLPTQPASPKRLIVREIGLLDATSAVLFDGTPDEARLAFAQEVPAALPILIGGVGNPGSRCAGCGVLALCPHPTRIAGLLGVAGRSAWVQAMTPGDLSTHAVCPAQLHYRRNLGLPRTTAATGVAGARGTLVHAWLAAAHDRGVPCEADDLPSDALGAVATELGWAEDQYRLARPYLLHHLDGCPLLDSEVGDVVSEQSLTVVDTDANIVFATRLDLTGQLGTAGRFVRETKTVNPDRLPEDERDLITYFPQVAFPIVALAAGLDPISGRDTGAPIAGRVELELLHHAYGTVIGFDVSDPDVLQRARVSIAQDVDMVIHDIEHQPRPGWQCRWCDVRDWCPAKSVVEIQLSDELDPTGDEDWGVPVERLGTLALIARAVAEDATGDEDIPF